MFAITIKKVIHACCPSFLKQILAKIEASEIGYRLAKGTFWSLTGAAISRGLMLVASIVVARLLGKTGYGELGMIQSTVGMFGVFAGFGLGMTATKHVAELRNSDPDRAGRIIGLSGLVAIITGGLMATGLIVFAPWLAEHTINAPHLAGVLQIGAILLFISALNGAQTGVLSGFEAFKTIAYVNLSVGLLSFPILIGGTYLGGLKGAVWALTINLGINWLLNHLALRKEARKYSVPFTFRKCGNEFSVLWRFSLPAVLSGAMAGLATWACNALLVNQPGGYGEMGVYNAILIVKQMPEMVLGMLIAPLLPMLSEYFGKGDTKSYNKILSYSFAMSLCLVVPVSFIQAAVPSLTLLPYGQEYQGYANTVQWLMFHCVLIGLFLPFGSILASMDRLWFGFTYNLFWGAFLLALTYLLVPRYGAAGLASALALTHLTTSLFCVGYIYQYEKAFIIDTPLAQCIIAVLFLFGVCTSASYLLPPLIAGGIGCLMALAIIVILIHLTKVRSIRKVSNVTTKPFTGE